MIYIGIDPGKHGGIAVLEHVPVPRMHDIRHVTLYEMPATPRALFDILLPLRRQRETPVRALMERVSSSPQMGVVSAFSFGRSYERPWCCLVGARIPFELIGPKEWQRVLGLKYPKGQKRDKNLTKNLALELFAEWAPRITHATADALLLAECCRLINRQPSTERTV